ncbi:Homeobox domain-containing protein, partial [Meloidogyne graminicola]
STTILKSYLFTLYCTRQFEEFTKVIEKNSFERSHHQDLVNLWYLAKYDQEECIKVKKLVPVDKYRIRKKFPPPNSIWDGDELIYSFRKGVREVYN